MTTNHWLPAMYCYMCGRKHHLWAVPIQYPVFSDAPEYKGFLYICAWHKAAEARRGYKHNGSFRVEKPTDAEGAIYVEL